MVGVPARQPRDRAVMFFQPSWRDDTRRAEGASVEQLARITELGSRRRGGPAADAARSAAADASLSITHPVAEYVRKNTCTGISINICYHVSTSYLRRVHRLAHTHIYRYTGTGTVG